MGILEESDDFLVIAIEKIIDDLAKPFPLFAKGLEGVMSFRCKSCLLYTSDAADES